MEDKGKCKMCCKLLFSVVFLFFIMHFVQAVHVVSFEQSDEGNPTDKDYTRHVRRKRSTETDSERKDNKCDSQKDKFAKAIAGGKRLETTHVFKSEDKFSLAMAWACKDDDGVLVVLTSEVHSLTEAVSTVWRSPDFGRTWKNISSQVKNEAFRKNDGLQRNPHDPKWIYLISYEHFIYKSEDGGLTWQRVLLAEMVKGELIFHDDPKYKDHVMVITVNNKLLMTKNNFKDVKTVAEDLVVKAHWGTEDSKSATDMFMTFGKTSRTLFPFFDDTVSLYKLQRRSSEGTTWETIKSDVSDFGIQGDFLYASIYKSDHPDSSSERILVVSNDAGAHWNEAQLPTITRDRFFSVLDMSEHMIFMHVDNPGDTGHGTLYTSWSRGIFFSESLQRHLYPNYNSITDFYKVSSMRGTYMASQLDKDNSIHSVITFDLGGEWHPLAKPADITCKDNAKDCSLQIHNSYSIHRNVNAHPPLSEEGAVGLIIVNAHAAQNLQTTEPDVFVSSDGGYSWRKALDGPHSYVIGDSGGLIVAISLKDPNPQELKFSTDEGRCWHVYQFTNQSIKHTGLLTEPGGKSMTVALWGYRLSDKKWIVNVIDFADVIHDHCTENDYEDWTPHETMKKEDSTRQGCLLGSKTKFRRLKHDSWCHNGYQYKAKHSDNVCPCGFDDFECDYGYYRPNDQQKCVKIPEFKGPEIDVCYRGHVQKVISEGYRKIPSDVCDEENGFRPESKYINLTVECSERFKLSIQDQPLEKRKTGHILLLTSFCVALIFVVTGLAYFGYRMVLLRRHKVVYRYSMLNQTDDKDFDEEIERTLTGTHPPPMFGDISDEEELPANPRPNGHLKKKSHMKGFHDDSDDDMLE